MPVTTNKFLPCDGNHCENSICQHPASERLARMNRTVTIGLVNNMPDAALEATERQFTALLEEASGEIAVDLSFYTLRGIPRAGIAAERVSQAYRSFDVLLDQRLDGLIVTGREPLTQSLRDEPYWRSFTELFEWARYGTYSTIWSCLAAHAAVLHADEIKRVRSPKKHFGALHCRRIFSHPITDGLPAQFQLPHSRWNGLPEEHLLESGYELLTVTEDSGVDSFCKDEKSLFVFFQGHPEYEASTLLLEYRRDVNRYLAGESDVYPTVPRNYFDLDTARKLAAVEEEARLHRDSSLLATVSDVLERAKIENTWRSTAVRLYANWIRYLGAQKRHQVRHEANIGAEKKRSNSEPEQIVVCDEVFPAAIQTPRTAVTDSRSTLTIR